MFLLVGKPILIFFFENLVKYFIQNLNVLKQMYIKFKVCFFFYDNGKQVLTVVIWDLDLCKCFYIFFLKSYIFGRIYDKRYCFKYIEV